MRHIKKQEIMVYTQANKKNAKENCFCGSSPIELMKDFKNTIISVFK